ncbi:MAG TPA: lysophospholipid acyltransferase family protein [Pyrinomonadaceae bacterium]|nr:lysophospholipid acyltransferase family protein [Pyrinomonadaceae bacterium]
MTRRIIIVVLRFALRVFFSRVEVARPDRVPAHGACMFVLNHQNGLVDPAFMLCYAPRPVSFLAKSTLFKIPVIGAIVRAMDSIPVYRKQDEGADISKNRDTFEQAAALLKRGGSLAICPEGISHNEPRLQPLKTGAARIALGAASSDETLDLKIIPAGLYYTAKTSFRSGALLYFGKPFRVAPVALDPDGEPSREAVRALSDRIAGALREVTLNADQHEALTMVARADRIFASEDATASGESSLERELRRRRRFVKGYAFHREHSSNRLEALETRIRLYEEQLRQAGIGDPRNLSTATVSKYGRARLLLTRAAAFVLLSPLAIAGALLHYPAYRLANLLAVKLSKDYDDVVSTFKLIAAMLLFPLTWTFLIVLSSVYAGWGGAVAALVLAPLAGYTALRLSEEFDRFVAGARAVLFFVTQRRFFRHLLAERKAIRKEILELGYEAERAGALEASG